MRPGSRPPAPEKIEAAILSALSARKTGASICPSEAARLLEPEHWRSLMSLVRRVAGRMADRGALEIRRKGKVITPAEIRGVIRLALPTGDSG